MNSIAIIGSGISGLGAAYLLHPHHAVTVYEKAAEIGGHTRTRTVRLNGKDIPVDTGFIVFNYRNYPNLSGLFKHLGVPVHKSTMSFGVSAAHNTIEWSAQSLGALFGQRENLLRPAFWRFLLDIVRFNAGAAKKAAANPSLTLGRLIKEMGLGDWFARYYILPMGGAIWSCPLSTILAFPARTFTEFFEAHGLLTVTNQPQWYTVTGGSREYLSHLIAPFRDRIRTGSDAANVKREGGKIQITDVHGQTQEYDHVVLACHGNEALAVLGDATLEERGALSAFKYQKNRAVLHKDTSFMPRRKKCWASWVYLDTQGEDAITVTYWMNQLQSLSAPCPLFVTLNPHKPIAPEHVFDTHVFEHPIYSMEAIAAQEKIKTLQGRQNTWFCGAHLRYGFHEDGLASALNVAKALGVEVPMALENGLLVATVLHARHRPKRNAFRYGVYYLAFALEDLKKLAGGLLSFGKPNLFSFYERDHAALDGSPMEPWIRAILARWNLHEADGRIVLIALPRVLGYVFNPVSFWFCLDQSGAVRAVLSEVCNTFGERHCYLSFHDDHRPIGQDDWLRAEKVFHVSPFMDVKGYYLFRFAYREDKIGVWIDHYDEEGLMLSTSVTGKRRALTSAQLAWCFLRYPLVTFKVIGLIHYQAVRLLLKGMRYRRKPLPPATQISR